MNIRQNNNSALFRHAQLFFAGLAVLLLSACGAAANSPTGAAPVTQTRPTPAPQPVPPALAALAGRVGACDALSSDAQPAGTGAQQPPNAADVANPAVVHYDDKSNTILLRKGAQTTLAGMSQIVGRPELLQQLAPGEWLLSANLRVEPGALLRVAAPEVRWLKLRSDDGGFVSIKALGGQIEFTSTCISSWDATRQQYDQNLQNGRSFVLARDGARMDVRASDIRYLGYDGPESYGLAWRLKGTSGQLIDSAVSYNFYGVYSYEVDDLVLRGNQVHHNIMYGLDPHTRSMRLVIENNVAHDNGKHGIILAEECSNAVVRNNVAYNNLHHGIVIYQRSNDNLVEGNTAFGNGGQGINVNDSANTIVRGNSVYDNLDAGIGIGQKASATQLLGNLVQANRRDGVTLYSDAAGSLLRENTISDNTRYGIHVKSAGELRVEGNEVAGNQVGIYLNAAQAPEISPATNRVHSNREADLRRADEQASAASEEESP
jgi:parallel beta-helix repeat protein